MKTKSRLLKIFATSFVALFIVAGAVSLAACGDSEITDKDVETLSAAVTETTEYVDSFTMSEDMKYVMTDGEDEQAFEGSALASIDTSNGVFYESVEEVYSESGYDDQSISMEMYIPNGDPLMDGPYKCYTIRDDEKSVSTAWVYFGPISYYFDDVLTFFDFYALSDISTVAELNDVMLDCVSDMGYDGSEEDVEVSLKVSGGKYTMSAVFEGGELSVSMTVKKGMVTKVSEYWKISEDEESIEISAELEVISYSYDASLASNFSDLSQWESE